jgi:hypothetical protein
MRAILAIVLLSSAGCASKPLVSKSLPAGSDFAHVVSADIPSTGSETLRVAYITEVLLPNGRSALPETGPGKVAPLVVLKDFFIRPGRYKIGYGCGIKDGGKLYEETSFAPNQQYIISCSQGTPRLIIETGPNNSFKPKPLRGSA